MSNKKTKEYAIPLLPSSSISDTLAFYKALGFVVTYQQKAPNTYVCLKIKDIEIHFFALKQLPPENNFSTCYLIVDRIDELYASFSAGLKAQLGKVPTKGFPRLNTLKDMPTYGVRQFIVVDPSGNYIRIGQPIKKEDSLLFAEGDRKPAKGTPLAKAYELGSRLANGKEDLVMAARTLDKAIELADTSDPAALFRVVSLRLDIAVRQSDIKRIKTLSLQGKKLLNAVKDLKAIEDDLRIFREIVPA